jgi:hypothetical protein
MAIKIIKSNTITLTQEKYDRLLSEWSASQQYTTVPQSFDSWVREYLEAEQRALAAAPHAASQPEDENDAHNFAICQHFDNWLIEKGALLTPHSEESDGPMAPALNWIASVEAMVAARAQADSVGRDAPAAGAVAGPDDDIDAIALGRYKVVPSHDSMLHRFAVVAGDGKQQLYLGRETECQNMARKFAGAFLDGAFYQSQIAAAPTPAAQQGDALDAERYRILRILGWIDSAIADDHDIDDSKPETLDAAIDTERAALAQKEGNV